MPMSLEHGPRYRCRKINKGRRTLETRTNGTWHDIPNTTHLRKKGKRKEGVLKSTKPNGRARLLNLLNMSLSLYPHACILALFSCTWETVP